MKIIFINPPAIRSKNSSPDNNFKTEGFVFKKEYKKILGFFKVFQFLNKKLGLGKGIRYGVRAGSRWPWTTPIPHNGPPYPFFMGYSAALLKSKGFEVCILDAIADEEYDYFKFLKKIREQNADIVVLETSTPTLDIDIWFANQVADFTDVALAGPHLTDQTTIEIKAQNPKIKYFLLGEYILSSLKMANTRKEGIYTPEIVEDLDKMPFPYRDYSSAIEYYDPTMPTARPQRQIYASKGCPFKCTFCLWPQVMYKGKVSCRKPELIIEEVKRCVDKYGYKSIFFDDDTFNIGNDRISELCKGLKKIGLPWTMMGRLDCSPDWLYDEMIDSGCVGMRFGIESFDFRVLKNIKKGLERTDFLKTLKYISNKYPDVMIHLTMMKNMPGQTKEIHKRDIEILQELGFSAQSKYRNYQLASCVPFPGTELHKELLESGYKGQLSDYKSYDGGQDTVLSEGLRENK